VRHGATHVHAGLGEGGDAASAQAVRGEADKRVAPIAGLPGSLLQDRPNAFGAEAVPAGYVVAGDAAEQSAQLDPGRIEPGPHGSDRTIGVERAGGDVSDITVARMVGFWSTRQEHAQPDHASGAGLEQASLKWFKRRSCESRLLSRSLKSPRGMECAPNCTISVPSSLLPRVPTAPNCTCRVGFHRHHVLTHWRW